MTDAPEIHSCTLSNSTSFPHSGIQTQSANCDGVDFDVTGNSGCIIQETAPNSVGPKFAGGVYAMYLSTNGVQIWFFPVRDDTILYRQCILIDLKSIDFRNPQRPRL